MVSFICDACGQTVKKQKVEKHYQSECRNCGVLSCIDCGEDFPGDTYVSHTSCISEAEKYQGKLYKAKDKANKGERKQQEWLEQVRTVSDETGKQDPRIRKLLAKITSYDNVPRKEAKFKKFCENSINVRDSILLEKLWQVFSGAKNSNLSSNGNAVSPSKTKSEEEDKGCMPEEDSVLNENGTENVSSKNTDLSQESCKAKKKQKMETREKKRKCDADTEEQQNGAEEDESHGKKKRVKRKKGKKGEQENNRIEVEEDESHGKKKRAKRKKEEKGEQENNRIEVEEDESHGKKKKVKRKKEEKEVTLSTDIQDQQEIVQAKFNWESIIKKLLKSAPDHEMPIKKLRKKVLNEFQARGGDSRPRTEQDLKVLFEKKLHKNPKVKVVKERAKLWK